MLSIFKISFLSYLVVEIGLNRDFFHFQVRISYIYCGFLAVFGPLVRGIILSFEIAALWLQFDLRLML